MNYQKWLNELTYLRLAGFCAWVCVVGTVLLGLAAIKNGGVFFALGLIPLGLAGVIFALCASLGNGRDPGKQ